MVPLNGSTYRGEEAQQEAPLSHFRTPEKLPEEALKGQGSRVHVHIVCERAGAWSGGGTTKDLPSVQYPRGDLHCALLSVSLRGECGPKETEWDGAWL